MLRIKGRVDYVRTPPPALLIFGNPLGQEAELPRVTLAELNLLCFNCER
jgi:hypothetical protein